MRESISNPCVPPVFWENDSIHTTKLNSPTSKLLKEAKQKNPSLIVHSPHFLVPSSFSRRWFVWNHPFEKYANVKLEHFPKFRGENKNICETTTYPPVNKHSNGKSPFLIGNTSWNGGFYIAMLDYRSVVLVVHLGWNFLHDPLIHPREVALGDKSSTGRCRSNASSGSSTCLDRLDRLKTN